ncbi:hypothetical protein [Streptomyces sp. NPDC058664]|uniref:hypothetical protein n=1 Tax=unclassified Streptomyces TaxID=2593676 RepID=UPI0036521C79
MPPRLCTRYDSRPPGSVRRFASRAASNSSWKAKASWTSAVGRSGTEWRRSSRVRRRSLADGGPISLPAVARRALFEELAVHATDDVDLELLGFGLDLGNNQWAAFFRAALPDLDEETLRRRWSRGVADKWEHDRFAFVPADPDSVLGFITDQPAETWTPCAPALFYLALVRGAVRRGR